MNYRIALGCMVALSGIACANEATTPAADASVETQIAQLPVEVEARAKAIDKLLTNHPGDPRVEKAARDFEADATPGLIRSVDFADGRGIRFVILQDDVVVAETGKQGQASKIAELGLSGMSAADQWRKLIPNEDVPTTLLEMEKRSLAAPNADVESGPIDTAAGVQGHGNTPLEAASSGGDANGDVGVAQQAFTASPDAFLNAGGCAVRPTRSGPDYQNIVATYCNTGYTGNGMWTAAKAWQSRWRVNSVSSGGFLVSVFRNGALASNFFVGGGYWINYQFATGYIVKCGGGGCWSYPQTDLFRLEVTQAEGDTMRVGAVYFNTADSRSDAQPWL